MNSPSTVTRTSVARRLALTVVVMLLIGIVAGLAWVWLAHPAEWEVRAEGLVQTEAASRGQFSVIVVFVVIGAVASIVWGLAAGWVLRDVGWVVTPAVVLATLAAAVIAWRLGVALGPADPSSITGATIGDKIPAELKIDGVAPFLVWPIFGLLGLIGTTWSDRRGS